MENNITDYLNMPSIDDQLFETFHQAGMIEPPKSFQHFEAKIVYYDSKNLVCVFPIKEHQTNPLKMLQGGILTALLDDTVGPLSFLIAKKPAVTTGFSVDFIRGIKPNTQVICKASLISKSRSTLLLRGEAYNELGKLAAVMTSHNMIMKHL